MSLFFAVAILMTPAPGLDAAHSIAHAAPMGLVTSVGLKIEPTENKPKAAAAPKPRRATKPKPKPVRYSLTGTWDWVSNCPAIGKVTGASTYKSKGNGQYIGALASSVGQKAQLKATLKGRDLFLSERYTLFSAKSQFRLSSNGRSYSGTLKNGCKVNARKR